ncbi:MAG: hypothetical protein ACI9ON_001615 [Limisphaerales bacterium]|jgi:hypothetical protein
MYRALVLFSLTICISTISHAQSQNREEAERQAREVISNFFEAFNTENHTRLASLSHYPSVLLGDGGGMRVNNEPFEIDFDSLRKREDWKHSELDTMNSVFTLTDKVHMLVRFTRYNSSGEGYSQIDGLWILTKQNGKWGVSARSY